MSRACKICIKLHVLHVYRCREACLKHVAINPSLELRFLKEISINKQFYELLRENDYVQPRMEALVLVR